MTQIRNETLRLIEDHINFEVTKTFALPAFSRNETDVKIFTFGLSIIV